MTREETIQLIGIITMAYPNFDKFRDERHIRSMVSVWADMFAEDDGHIVAMAIKQHISTSKWPPSIAEIRELMVGIRYPDIIPPDEAWAAVSKLLYTEGEHCSDDIHRLLPKPIAEAVEAVGYSQLYALRVAHARGHSGKAGLDRVAFLQAYEAKIERLKQQAMLPAALRRGIEAVKESFSDGSQEMLDSLDRRQNERKEFYRELEAGVYSGASLLENKRSKELASGMQERTELDDRLKENCDAEE